LGQIADSLAQARAVQAEQEDRVRPVMLAEIYADPAIQVRVEGLNEEHVEALAQILLNGGSYADPIRLFEDSESGRLYMSDGFHRQAAYKRAVERAGGRLIAPLEAEIFPGGYAAAVEDAEERNLTHGLKLSAQDKFNIFKRRFERSHEWTTWSNVRIGAALGVAEGTVRNWRAKFYEGSKSRSQDYEPQRAKKPETRVGADGKSYPIRPPEQRAQPKGVTPPPQRYVTDEWSQAAPDEEPALTYDEVEEANWPGPIVPRDEPVERPPVTLDELMVEARRRAAQQQRDLDVPAIPDSYDAELETAISIAAHLEKHVTTLIHHARAVQEIKGIRSFYRLEPERLAVVDIALSQTMDALVKAWDHLELLRKRIDVIQQTGEPYPESEDSQ
jgi:hypothetical protein